MPEIFDPDVADPWPPWATIAARKKVPIWPQSNSPRTNGRLWFPSAKGITAIASRHWCRLHWSTMPFDPQHWEWFYYDLVSTGIYTASGNTGVSRTGVSCQLDLEWTSDFTPFGSTGHGVVATQTFTLPGEPLQVRKTFYHDDPEPNGSFRYVFDRAYVPDTPDTGSLDRTPSDGNPFPTFNQWPYVVCDWQCCSECFPFAQFEP